MNTEALKQLADIINGLGDKGLSALIIWVVLDFAKALLGWTGLALCIGLVVTRLRDAVVGGIKASQESQ